MRRFWALLLVASLAATAFSGCLNAYRKSVGGETSKVFSRIYLTDFNTAWQSSLDALKSSRLDVSNREGGFIQTRWTDNTAEKNFIDSFAGDIAYLKAQYRFKLTLAKGYYNGKPSVKVSVLKEQLVQHDVLEGWKPVETDTIDENTLLYRVGRIILIRMRIAKIEEHKTQKQMETAPAPATPSKDEGSDDESRN